MKLVGVMNSFQLMKIYLNKVFSRRETRLMKNDQKETKVKEQDICSNIWKTNVYIYISILQIPLAVNLCWMTRG